MAGQFIYDFNCILDSRKRNFDIILQLGYTSSSVWSFLLPKYSKIVTNMDGLEWKRSKYSKRVQYFLKHAERWAVNASNRLVADSLGIQSYLKKKYNRKSIFIPYGANIFNDPDESVLEKYHLQKGKYYLAIARFEPENNIETIIKSYMKSGAEEPLIMIGSTQNKFGKYIISAYSNERIIFCGNLYDIHELNNLRYFSNMYFHGHSVGGTNPSLLEAMSSQALICAHQNEFNFSVLGDDALYFSDENELAACIKKSVSIKDRIKMISENMKKIETKYTWKNVIDEYENLMLESKQ
jgi:glycosyltransferase involved in cell wall biosynthesis